MNKKSMKKDHEIHQPVTVILQYCLLWLTKISLLAFSGNNAIEEVKIVDRFKSYELINHDSPNMYQA